jgi:lipopolysaccharide export LptBFGC system permease protein LptF
MSSFIYLLIAALISFVFARMHKDPKMYTNLVGCILFGFVVGMGFQHAVANAQKDSSNNVVVTTAVTPMSQSTSAVVETVADTQLTGQDTVTGDTVVTNTTSYPTTPITSEIVDDS